MSGFEAGGREPPRLGANARAWLLLLRACWQAGLWKLGGNVQTSRGREALLPGADRRPEGATRGKRAGKGQIVVELNAILEVYLITDEGPVNRPSGGPFDLSTQTLGVNRPAKLASPWESLHGILPPL